VQASLALTVFKSISCCYNVPAGGNSGLGVETARAMAHAGARVILTSRKVEAGQEVARQLQSSGVKVEDLLVLALLVSINRITNFRPVASAAGPRRSITTGFGRPEQCASAGQTAQL